jgi:hypothetical protein
VLREQGKLFILNCTLHHLIQLAVECAGHLRLN